jgi:hypothetical protein
MQNIKEMSDVELYNYKKELDRKITKLSSRLIQIEDSTSEYKKDLLSGPDATTEKRVVALFEDFLKGKNIVVDDYINSEKDNCYYIYKMIENLTNRNKEEVFNAISTNFTIFLNKEMNEDWDNKTVNFILDEMASDPDFFKERIDGELTAMNIIENILNPDELNFVERFFDKKDNISFLFKNMLDKLTVEGYTEDRLNEEILKEHLEFDLACAFKPIKSEYKRYFPDGDLAGDSSSGLHF